MISDRLARAISASLARHQTRGLVDDAAGMADVVIHGRVDMLAVASDVLAATLGELHPPRRSWAGWFVRRAAAQRDLRRLDREREALAGRLATSDNPADNAIARLRLRKLDR